MDDIDKIYAVRDSILLQFAKTEFVLHKSYNFDFAPHFDHFLKPKTKTLLYKRLASVENTGFDCDGIIATYRQNLFVDIPRFLAMSNALIPEILSDIYDPVADELAQKAIAINVQSQLDLNKLHQFFCHNINDCNLHFKNQTEMENNLGSYKAGKICLLETMSGREMAETYSHEFFHALVEKHIQRFDTEKYPFPIKQRKAFVLFMTNSMICSAIKATKLNHLSFDPYYHSIDEVMARNFTARFNRRFFDTKLNSQKTSSAFAPC